ncbi:tyrosine-tRNA ligase [Candidatus Phycosocius bacilliformis]|uniref:Tyrosine--tRNA ligase n=2 Tax=Candidatus Phycosocius bacilliformis TaxID=1445552 RepID=A0A2P2ECW7_9PROT|nr:tyrosine-tRNA ligase [Candidatus Phycosocius bacilliformis]
MTHKSAFVQTLMERGHYYQATDLEALDAAALESERGGRALTGYIGYDCTAPSLHVGSLTQIMLMRRLQQCGGKPITLMGGGTTKVGDPSDKNEARPVLTQEVIDANKASIQTVFAKFLTFGDGPRDAIMVDNAQWLDEVKWLDMLREIGKHFTINKMIALDIVKRRLDQEVPITFLEFNYMLLQAYDFLELSRRYDCNLQMGGSDQWGNIVQGVELCRRVDERHVLGVTQPLLMNAAGQKMGKTANGAVWLNADMLSPFDYWQYWRNVDDADVEPLMKRMTDLPLDEIDRYAALGGSEINLAKIVLATETTALLHGREAAEAAKATAAAQFGGGGADAGLPVVNLASVPASLAALFVAAGLVESNGEAKRQAKGGGLRLNDKPVQDVTGPVPPELDKGQEIKLSLGKKRHLLVKLAG